MAEPLLILRTVRLDPDVDDALNEQAYVGPLGRNDLIRHYLRLGIEAAEQGALPGQPFGRATPAQVPRKAGPASS